MSDIPAHRPRHARSDTGPSVPTQDGPRADAPAADPAVPAAEPVPEPARPADDLPTQVLPVIPRPRRGDTPVTRLPEPSRPAAVPGPGATTTAPGPSPEGGFRFPELPETVRPVLPAVLGAVTVLILALGIVAGVNGAPAPAAPEPPAPVNAP